MPRKQKTYSTEQLRQYAKLLLVANDQSFDWFVYELDALLRSYGAKHKSDRRSLLPAPSSPKIQLSELLNH